MQEDRTSYAKFENGRLLSIDRPDWFAKMIAPALENESSDRECFLEAGYCVALEIDYEESEDELRIYRSDEDTANARVIVEVWERSTLISYILIEEVAAYLEFKAKFIAPWVSVMEAAARTAKPSPFASALKAA